MTSSRSTDVSTLRMTCSFSSTWVRAWSSVSWSVAVIRVEDLRLLVSWPEARQVVVAYQHSRNHGGTEKRKAKLKQDQPRLKTLSGNRKKTNIHEANNETRNLEHRTELLKQKARNLEHRNGTFSRTLILETKNGTQNLEHCTELLEQNTETRNFEYGT